MQQKFPKKAVPKPAQQRKTAEAQETMGNLRQKKPRPPKNYFSSHHSNIPTFWEKLVLNWHNYSVAQKIAVITAGLVLSGVALYIAVALAQSVYTSMSAELDTPSRTREPSVFTRMDRALSFPMASAESLPQTSSLFRNFPDFLTGTTQYSKSEAGALFRLCNSLRCF